MISIKRKQFKELYWQKIPDDLNTKLKENIALHKTVLLSCKVENCKILYFFKTVDLNSMSSKELIDNLDNSFLVKVNC